MPCVVSVAWVEGGRVRGFGRAAVGGMLRVMVVVFAAAARERRERRERRGVRSEVRMLAVGMEHLRGVVDYLGGCWRWCRSTVTRARASLYPQSAQRGLDEDISGVFLDQNFQQNWLCSEHMFLLFVLNK